MVIIVENLRTRETLYFKSMEAAAKFLGWSVRIMKNSFYDTHEDFIVYQHWLIRREEPMNTQEAEECSK
jgi:hypothetical protein